MIRKALLAVMVVASSQVGAKNLDGRVGFGLTYLDFTASPALSMKYFHTNLLSTVFVAGFNTDVNTYQLGIKTVRQVVLEENLNVFLGVGGFLVNSTALGTGVEFDALAGAEFFFAGLPNLGFQFEIGIGLRSQGRTTFRSIGGGFGSGAIHYYF